jgi:hypothetical protein
LDSSKTGKKEPPVLIHPETRARTVVPVHQGKTIKPVYFGMDSMIATGHYASAMRLLQTACPLVLASGSPV